MNAMRRWMLGLTITVLAAAAAPVRAAGEVTLFVAPARYSVLQVMFDVAARRPSAVVSYQGNAETAAPLLHVWQEGEWVQISPEQFRTGAFLGQRPDRVVLIGGADLLPAVLLQSAQDLAPAVVQVKDMDPASLVNAAGGMLKFTKAEWEWFAKRYNMQLEDTMSKRRTGSWYDQPRSSKRLGPSPLDRSGAAQPPPAPVVPEIESEAPEAVKEPAKDAAPAPVMPPTALAPAGTEKPAPKAAEAGIK